MVNKKEYKLAWARKNKDRIKGQREAKKEEIKEQNKARYRKLSPEQKEKRLLSSKESYIRNKVKILKRTRERHLQKNYGLSSEEYLKLVEDQSNLCAICEKPETRKTKTGDIKPLSVDHNHTTGEVRMLLCNDCNALLGFCKEDISILENSIKYLKFFMADLRNY